MTKQEKLIAKLEQANKTFIFTDLVTLLTQLGYTMHEREGSRVVFIHNDDRQNRIHLHKPHPENTIKDGALKAVKAYLVERGYLSTANKGDNTNDDL